MARKVLITNTRTRKLKVEFDEGNYLLSEVVKEDSETRTDVIWLTYEEIMEIRHFSMKCTGEIL